MMQTNSDRFITFLSIFINPSTYGVTIINAGHPPVLLHSQKKNQVVELGVEQAGLPLGLYDRPYEKAQLSLEPGDTLILYSDGITEARNPEGNFYNLERLINTISKAAESAADKGKRILEDVSLFSSGRSQTDDITLICIRRQPLDRAVQ